MFTGKQLADYCEQVYKVGWVYWYGTFGQKCTQALYKSKKKQYPSHYTAARASGYEKDTHLSVSACAGPGSEGALGGRLALGFSQGHSESAG